MVQNIRINLRIVFKGLGHAPKNLIVSIAASSLPKGFVSIILAGALLKYGVFPFFETENGLQKFRGFRLPTPNKNGPLSVIPHIGRKKSLIIEASKKVGISDL